MQQGEKMRRAKRLYCGSRTLFARLALFSAPCSNAMGSEKKQGPPFHTRSVGVGERALRLDLEAEPGTRECGLL